MCFLNSTHKEQVLHYLKENEDHFRFSRGLYPENYFTAIHQELRLKQELRKRNEGRAFRFYIIEDKSQRILGDVHFNEIVRGAFQSCFVGYKVSKEDINRGIMTKALREACRFMFKEYELHRIEANIMPSNLASIRVVEKVGFQNEGLAKRFLKINGQWEDHLRFALLNETS